MRRFLTPVALAFVSGCWRSQRPQAAAPVAEEKAAQADCTRLIADTAKLRNIVTEPARHDSLDARCRKRNLNIKIF